MIESLKQKKNNQNFKIIDDLIFIIVDQKIKTLEELKKLQESNFIMDNKRLNIQETIAYCIALLKDKCYDYEQLNFQEIQVYKQLKNELEKDTSIHQKIKNLILLYAMTDREMLFPYYAYLMIENNII